MKKIYYVLITLATVLLILVGGFFYKRSIPANQTTSALPRNWEKLFEMERIEIRNNYSLLKDSLGYYDHNALARLANHHELDTLRDAFDSMMLDGIIIAGKDTLLFQSRDSSTDVVWYCYGEDLAALKKHNFEVQRVIAGKNNWYFITTRKI